MIASNIFCLGAAIWTAYILFDGWRKGSLLLKGGRRADRDQSPGTFLLMSFIYTIGLFIFIIFPLRGINIFGNW